MMVSILCLAFRMRNEVPYIVIIIFFFYVSFVNNNIFATWNEDARAETTAEEDGSWTDRVLLAPYAWLISVLVSVLGKCG